MEKIMIAGDTHGNTNHVFWLIDQAVGEGVDTILQLGDFGAWEHTEDGRKFFSDVNRRLTRRNVTLYWIDGNHDKISLTLRKHTDTDENGFVLCRDRIRYIPRGTVWEWEGMRFLGFGGAYSVDKAWRLDLEAQRRRVWEIRRDHGSQRRDNSSGYFWFPEEEPTQEEFDRAMGDGSPVDIMVTHDKPRAANPRWNRKDLPECWPNQDRIQALVRARKPAALFHGHLHYPYEDLIHNGDETYTHVVGLDCDDAYHPGYNPRASYCLLRLGEENVGKLALNGGSYGA